ncbi:MAG: hypothetical protein PUD63_12320 [Clostridia bacterium]|nr:hypothetical protein [Clostridia bacterium]
MTRFDLIAYSGVMKEYRPMNWMRRRAYSRRIDRALRYVCPRDRAMKGLAQTIACMAVLLLMAGCAVAFPVLFVRWWMCV